MPKLWTAGERHTENAELVLFWTAVPRQTSGVDGLTSRAWRACCASERGGYRPGRTRQHEVSRRQPLSVSRAFPAHRLLAGAEVLHFAQ
jgi:hypothetical protein